MRTRKTDWSGWLGPILRFIVLLTVSCFPASFVSAAFDGLVLNELMASNDTTIADESGEYDDWIEILNTSAAAVNLQGLALTDNLAEPEAFLFPSVTLNPGEYLMIWADDDPEQGNFHAAFKLSASGEALYLLAGADIVDHTDFPALGVDISWGRWPDGSGDWKIMGLATPGEANEDPEPPQIAVYLNEVMADNYSTLEDPQESGEYPDWIELYNAESYTVDLSGMFLSDDAAEPNKYEIPNGVTIPSKGFLIFIADDESEQGSLHTNFKLSASGDSVFLITGGFVLDQTTFGTLGRDISWGRYPDGTGSWKQLGVATPGSANRDPDFPEIKLYINEFMADNTVTIEDPDEPGQYPDWIELYNAESSALDLSGMYLSDEPEDLTKYPIPNGVSIPAHGYIVFWADDEPDQGPLHTNFKLGQGSEIIQLYRSDGQTEIDTIEFSSQQTDVSFGRYPDGTDNWGFHSNPTPGSENHPESGTGMTLYMDDKSLSPGDRFHLYFTLWPAQSTYKSDVYLLLDIHGMYWSWPDWKNLNEGLGFKQYAIYPENQIDETVMDFTWPDVGGNANGLNFYGVAMQEGTYHLIGDLQVATFEYH